MKKIILIILLITSNIGISQNIFNYEKKIKNKEEYHFQDIEFENTDENIILSGTLITPKNDYEKIVIIATGSDQNTRYSYFVLAEEFLKNGIAVYRFDERGVGKSEDNYTNSTTKLSNDLTYIYQKLKKDYKTKPIGLFKHSGGGMTSLEIIQNGLNPSFLILMGTPVLKNSAYILHGIKQDIENHPSLIEKKKTKPKL